MTWNKYVCTSLGMKMTVYILSGLFYHWLFGIDMIAPLRSADLRHWCDWFDL